MNTETETATAGNADAGVTETTAGPKERALFVLRALMELIENDRVRADQIATMSAGEILDLAEAEAAKAVEGSAALANS